MACESARRKRLFHDGPLHHLPVAQPYTTFSKDSSEASGRIRTAARNVARKDVRNEVIDVFERRALYRIAEIDEQRVEVLRTPRRAGP